MATVRHLLKNQSIFVKIFVDFNLRISDVIRFDPTGII
jgi:hypothetical protein